MSMATVIIGRIAEVQLNRLSFPKPVSDFNRGYDAALVDLKILIKDLETDHDSTSRRARLEADVGS